MFKTSVGVDNHFIHVYIRKDYGDKSGFNVEEIKDIELKLSDLFDTELHCTFTYAHDWYENGYVVSGSERIDMLCFDGYDIINSVSKQVDKAVNG
jgi:hypothetical protein